MGEGDDDGYDGEPQAVSPELERTSCSCFFVPDLNAHLADRGFSELRFNPHGLAGSASHHLGMF